MRYARGTSPRYARDTPGNPKHSPGAPGFSVGPLHVGGKHVKGRGGGGAYRRPPPRDMGIKKGWGGTRRCGGGPNYEPIYEPMGGADPAGEKNLKVSRSQYF